MSAGRAIRFIDENGILLVFPLDNRPEPPSLWSCFHPRKKMRWEWDENGDEGVAELWHLREELSRSRKVVYAKWYRGRATFFSRDIFVAMLRILGLSTPEPQGLGESARRIYRALDLDSPLSTKELKRETDLSGRFNESAYNRGLQELFSRLLVVGFGEVDEGAFPSLAIGATHILFEDLWEEARELSLVGAEERLRTKLAAGSLFLKHLERVRKKIASAPAGARSRSGSLVNAGWSPD